MASKSNKPTSISFKSSGKDSTSYTANNAQIEEETLPPLSIKTPLELSNNPNDSLFVMHREIDDVIQDDFRSLLLTSKGERLGRTDYGCSLKNLTFELISSENFENNIMTEIQESVTKYLPFIQLQSFSSNNFKYEGNDDSSLANLQIDIMYDIPKLGITNKIISLNLLIGG